MSEAESLELADQFQGYILDFDLLTFLGQSTLQALLVEAGFIDGFFLFQLPASRREDLLLEWGKVGLEAVRDEFNIFDSYLSAIISLPIGPL